MPRTQALPLVCLFAFGLALGFPARSVRAQVAGSGSLTPTGTTVTAGNFTVQLMQVGPDKYQDSTTYMTPIGKKACDNGYPLYFRLSNFPNNYTKMETWIGTSCADPDRNTRGTTVEGRCTYITSEDLSPGNQTIFDNYQVPTNEICMDPAGDGDRTIWFLALNTSGMEVVQATAWASITLRFDFTPPSQIDNLTVGNGYTQLEANWAEPSGDPYYYYLLIDPTGKIEDEDGGTTGCVSSFLTPGKEIDPTATLPTGIFKDYIDEKARRTSLNGMDWGTDTAAIGIIPVDRALNNGPLSNVVCPRIVPTQGFWETYKMNGGEAEPGCNCSAPGGQRGNGFTGPLALGMLGLAVLVRRARRRR